MVYLIFCLLNNSLTKINLQQGGGDINGLVGSTAKYFIINGTNTPSGTERHGFLICLYYSGLYFAPYGGGAVPLTKQIYMPFWGAERLFTRTYRHDTSAWTSWKEF